MIWRRWGEGPPLVLFHGSAGSWNHWIRTIDNLAGDHAVWIPDLPGDGDSAQPVPHNDIDAAIAALLHGLDVILPQESLTIVTFSAGLVHGAGVAAQLAGRVHQLVAVSPGAVGPVDRLPMRSLRGVSDPGEIDAVNRHNLATLMLADHSNVDDLALYIHTANSRRSRFRLQYVVEGSGAPALDRLKAVRAPLAVIWAGFDAARPNVDHYRQLFEALRPGLPFHVLDDAGHWVMYETPVAFTAMLRTLLDRVS
jgi:pimeloyl-ACP methyl ester carboxylesterase